MQPHSKKYLTQWIHDIWRNPFLFWAIVAGFVTIFPVLYIPKLNTVVFKHAGISWVSSSTHKPQQTSLTKHRSGPLYSSLQACSLQELRLGNGSSAHISDVKRRRRVKRLEMLSRACLQDTCPWTLVRAVTSRSRRKSRLGRYCWKSVYDLMTDTFI